MQAKLLEGLGLKGYLMMDSKNPVNLFSAASGMMAGMSGERPPMDEEEEY